MMLRPMVVVVVIAQQLFSYRQLSGLRKSGHPSVCNIDENIRIHVDIFLIHFFRRI